MKPLAANVLIQDRYLIVHLIGKGGMGEVYLAVDQRLGSAVALKRTFFSDDVMLATAFEREARILANLRHPILPKVSDHFVDGENQFLVMEHITGDDLSKRLEKTQQPFPLSWVLFWADQLLDALNYLHTHEPPIIHRDIKPQNLKLTNDNHIVLLDFGLSKNSVGETRTSSTGSVVGYTPHYAPMEQIRGTGTNAQSDLYSLSATVYQLLTNNVPPDALTRADSLLSGLPDPLRPINELNKEVTPEVSAVILKGMDIRQDSRHPSAREMQKNLRDAYSRLQTAMSAQTIAFNVNDQQIGFETQTSKPEPPFETPLPSQTQNQVGSGNLNNHSYSDQSDNSFSPNNPAEQQNLDATVQFDATSLEDLEVKPSDIKTEVLLAGDSSAIQAAQEGREIPLEDDDYSEPKNFQTADTNFTDTNFKSEENFSTTNDYSNNDNFSPDETFPLIPAKDTADEFKIEDEEDDDDDAFAGVGGTGETAFFSNIAAEEGSSNAGATFITNRDELEREEVKPEPAVQPVPPPKKSSGGKKFAIIGVVLVLFFIGLGAIGGVAWYLSQPDSTTGNETPSPTTAATVEITPSPEPTMDTSLIDTNSNTEGNEDISNVNSQTGGENINTSTGGTTQPTGKPTTAPTATPKPITKPTTPKPITKPTTPKPTAAPTKKPGGGILQ